MRNFDKRIIWIYSFIGIYLFLVSFYATKISKIYNLFINPIFWLLLALFTLILLNSQKIRYKAFKDKSQIILIIMLCYILAYFLSGLLFGFVKNIYSTHLYSLLKNIWSFALILIFKEFVREKLVKYSGGKNIFLVLITLLFIISDIEMVNISYYFSSSKILFKYFFSIVFPIISANVLATYLVSIGGFKTSIVFRIPMILIKLVSPLQPDLDWFMLGIFEGLIPPIIYAVINRYHSVRTSRESKRELKTTNPLPKIITIGVLVIFGFFVAGLFKIMPVAVMSGSMDPIFKRGDIVIVKKVKEEDCDKLNIYDIIEYRIDDKIVLHRIIKKEKINGELMFTTKGDNNEIADNALVSPSQIIGTIEFKVKYIGYPSVLLNEYFSK